MELLKESKLCESLTQKEKQAAINHALRITQLSITEKTYGIFGKIKKNTYEVGDMKTDLWNAVDRSVNTSAKEGTKMHDSQKGTTASHAKSMACMTISLIALVLLVFSVGATFANHPLMGGAIQGTPLNLVPAAVTTFAGPAQGSRASSDTDGTGNAARFNYPYGITTDGTNLYVADNNNNKIRKIVIATGAVTTLAGPAQGSTVSGDTDDTGNAARFKNPSSITTDGTNLYVADSNNNKIRKIVIATGAVTTLAGPAQGSTTSGDTDDTGNAARFYNPNGITTDGTNLYVADSNNNKIRKIVIATGAVTTLAGPAQGSTTSGDTDGTGNAARFYIPSGITTDGTNLYVADYFNNKIRQIVITTGVVTTLAGPAQGSRASGDTDGTGNAARFYIPSGITTDGTNLYVADAYNNKIRQIVITTGVVTDAGRPGPRLNSIQRHRRHRECCKVL